MLGRATSPALRTAPALLAALCVMGCHLLESGEGLTEQSILKSAAPSDDSVVLDIFWVRLPVDFEAEESGFWSQIQEDRIAVGQRRRLADNGMRAGVIGAAPPDELLRLINPSGAAGADAAKTALEDTGVRRRTRQLRMGKKLEINASQVIAEAPLVLASGGGLSGRTFHQAQGVYVLETALAEDEKIEVSLLPEVRHGEQSLRFAADETGVISRGALTRDAESLTDLRVAAALSAGEMLLVTSLPEAGSRLGELFHTTADGAVPARKAILVRIASAPPTRAFLEGE